ncbi:unnamed protein product [Linum tenue]|uniref:Uncharacterized protein n=1 Tax=Linum tenue TaxID=586396 RepID=A0AAV0PY61_9ROSI|nr:unnamed protein product [Linum tenue]
MQLRHGGGWSLTDWWWVVTDYRHGISLAFLLAWVAGRRMTVATKTKKSPGKKKIGWTR